MKHSYFCNISLATVFAFGLLSCNQEKNPQVMDSGQTINNPIEKVSGKSTENRSSDKEAFSNSSHLASKDLITEKKGSKNKSKTSNIEADREIKGIEDIALYRKQISKGIYDKETKYSNGYIMKEYQKAQKGLAQKGGSENARYSVEFTERGPANVPGRARGIEINPSDPNNWYIGTAGGGIWETNDAGQTWFNTTDYAIPNLATPTLDSPESNPDIIYAGTGEPYGHLDRIGGFGVVKSIDAGATWDFLESTNTFGDVGRLVVDPNNANVVVAGTLNGIFKTTDGGQSWIKTRPNTYIQDVIYTPGNFNIIYASNRGVGILKSIDAGDSWELVLDAHSIDSNLSRMEIDVSPVNPDKVIIAGYAPGETFYIVSDDGLVTNTTLTPHSTADNGILNAQGWYDNALSCHPFDENIFYSGGIYMAKVTINPSTDVFSTQPIAAGYGNASGQINRYVHVDMQNITYQINPANSSEFRLILACDGGVYFTDFETDPGTTENDWSVGAVGMNSTQFYGADKQNGFDNYVAGAQDNGSWLTLNEGVDAGTTYQFVNSGDGFKAIWNYQNPAEVLVTSQFNNIVRIDLATGDKVYARHEDHGSASPFYSKITNADNNSNVVFSPSSNGVWRTPNFGRDWSLAAIDSKWVPSSSSTTSSMEVAVSAANPNVVWAGAAMTESSSYTMHISNDNGQTFEPVSVFKDPRSNVSHNQFISGLGTSPTNENRAYCLSSSYNSAKVLRTNDKGQSWEDISGFSSGEDRGFPDVAVHSIMEMPFDANIIWVGTDIGIFETQNGGTSWNLIEGIPPVSVWGLKFVNDEVVISSHGRGIWTATIPELLNFEYATYMIAPEVVSFSQTGLYDLHASLEYTYTSPEITAIQVYIDDQLEGTINNGISPNTNLSYTSNSTYTDGYHTVEIVGVNGAGTETIATEERGIFIAFNEAKDNYNISEFSSDDITAFDTDNFVVNNVNNALDYDVLNNVGHPYENNRIYETYLKTPFLNSAAGNGVLTLEQIVMTEGNYDFAYVQASTDLKNWINIGVFDETDYPSDWGASSNVSDDSFKASILDFTQDFDENDKIAIRLKLVTDPYVNKEGWFIKSLINSHNVGVQDLDSSSIESKAKISPNPVEKNINIYLSNQSINKVDVTIYDLTGRRIQAYKNINPISGNVVIPFKKVKSGNYIAVIKTDEFTQNINFLKK